MFKYGTRMDPLVLVEKHFDVIDYVVFGFLLLCSALIGVYFGFMAKQKQNSTKEYLMGGKTMGIFPVSMSLISSSISAISLLALPAEMYLYGTQFFMTAFGQSFASLLTMFVYLPVFYKLQITSSYEYLNLRFNHPVRLIGSMIFILKMLLYIPIVIYVPALAFSQVTGINLHLITPVVCIVCIFYTTIGGLKAVVWTDTLQTVLMYGGVTTVMVLGTIKAGGLSEVLERNRQTDRLEFFNMDLDPTLRSTFWTVTIGEFINFASSCTVNQAVVQRCLAMPNLRKSTYSVVILTVGLFVIVAMSCYTGIVIYALFRDCDPVSTKMINKSDQLLPYFVMQISESVPGLPGLFVAGVFSAALSSMSTGLNSMTGVILQDMIRPWLNRPITELTASNIMKVVAALTGVICVALVFVVERMGSLMQVAVSLSSITSGALLGMFSLGMFFPWANSKGAFVGSISSMLVVGFISAGSQMAMARGDFVHEQKSLFTDNCPANVFNQTAFNLATEHQHVDVFYGFRISYMYYTMIGAITVIVVGMAVSFATGLQDPKDVSRDLLTPVIHRFLPKHPVQPEEEKMNKIATDFITPPDSRKGSLISGNKIAAR